MRESLIPCLFLLLVFGVLFVAGLMTHEKDLAFLTVNFGHEKESGSDLSGEDIIVPTLFLTNVSNGTFEYFEIGLVLRFNKKNKVNAEIIPGLVDRYISKLYDNVPVGVDGNVKVEELRKNIFLITQVALGLKANELESVLFNSVKQTRSRHVL